MQLDDGFFFWKTVRYLRRGVVVFDGCDFKYPGGRFFLFFFFSNYCTSRGRFIHCAQIGRTPRAYVFFFLFILRETFHGQNKVTQGRRIINFRPTNCFDKIPLVIAQSSYGCLWLARVGTYTRLFPLNKRAKNFYFLFVAAIIDIKAYIIDCIRAL